MARFLPLLAPLLLAACAGTPAQPENAPGPEAHLQQPAPQGVQALLQQQVPRVARNYLGHPYRWGGNPDRGRGSDCSHLISAVTRNAASAGGLSFTPYYLTTSGIRDHTTPIPRSQVRVGDLLLFHNDPDKQHNAAHAGIITHVSGGVIVFTHASSQQGVIETSLDSDSWHYYWKERLDSFRRWRPELFRTPRPHTL